MVESRPGKPIESDPGKELPTPEDFLADNQSAKAEENRTLFREARLGGRIFVIRTCSDSRAANGLPPHRALHVPTIAAVGNPAPYEEMNRNQSIAGIANVIHYDGIVYKPGQRPEKCGGFDAKSKAKRTQERKGSGLERYIDRIPSDDPVIANIFQAELIANISKKPVLAAIQDHRSGIFIPMVLFLNGGTEIRTSPNLPMRYMFQDLYDPKLVYEKGIPCIDETELTPEFQELLELNKVEAIRIQRETPNFIRETATQNPEYLIFTTEKTTARERYPQLLEKPSSYFTVHLPRESVSNRLAFITREATVEAIEQAEYPIGHFDKIHTILIETPSIEQSGVFAKELLKTMRNEDWKQVCNFQIFIAASISGSITRVETFKKN